MRWIECSWEEKSRPLDASRLPVRFPRGQTVILLALHNLACPACVSIVNGLMARRDELTTWSATPFVVPTDSLSSSLQEVMPSLANGPVDGSIVLVLDTFAAPYAIGIGDHLDASAIDEALAWVRLIGSECPE